MMLTRHDVNARGDKDDVVLVIHIILVTMYSLQNYTPTFPIYVTFKLL